MKLIRLLITLIFPFYLYGQSNPVVIELFTSQGCSSCPAADKNLTTLLSKFALEDAPVYGLSFHVDYWNYIGWKDPYSSKEFTERQRNYAEVMKLPSIYTPQMIINGKYEFVGSNKNQAEKLIRQSLSEKPAYQITVTNLMLKDNYITFTYNVDKRPAEESLTIAIVERKVQNDVLNGENSGKRLSHDNVVRKLMTITAQKDGKVQMDISQTNLSNGSVIIYLQNKRLSILGATSASF